MACLVALTSLAQGEDSAQALYERGAYQEALVAWSEELASGNTSAALYFNLGLAHSALNQTAHAVMNFEKALRIKPGDEKIVKAITLEREKILDAAIPVKPFFLKQWYRKGVMVLRPGAWAALGLFLLLSMLALMLFRLRDSPGRWKDQLTKKRFWMAGAGVCLILACLSYAELYRTNEAIIMEACAFHQAPSEESPMIIELGPGEKVVITDHIGEWLNVYLVNQEAGWVRNTCVERIRIGSSDK